MQYPALQFFNVNDITVLSTFPPQVSLREFLLQFLQDIPVCFSSRQTIHAYLAPCNGTCQTVFSFVML